MSIDMATAMVPSWPTTANLTMSQFTAISNLVKRRCGIKLHDGKVALVKARLNKRLRALGLHNFGQYVERICDDADEAEMTAMLDALSTNLTYFFREPRHFEVLKNSVIPRILARHARDRRFRIWSAGCSSGEEAYSIAMIVKEAVGKLTGWDAGILATDLSWPMLKLAREGTYQPQQLRETPGRLIQENFTPIHDGAGRRYQVKQPLRRMVHFARLNLMDPWPMKGPFDAIFCRNVMIYFEKPTQHQLVQRFWDMLAFGGVLFVGHSESLTRISHRFRYLEPTVYQKT
jgi:chemotaxis protein methyltransferase CheR